MRLVNTITLLLLTLLPFSASALEGSFSVGCGKGEVANEYDTTRCDASLDLSIGAWSIGTLIEHRDVDKGKGDPSEVYACSKYSFSTGTVVQACGSEDRYLLGFMHKGEPVYQHRLFLDGLYYLAGIDHGKTWEGGSSRTRSIIGAGWVMTPKDSLELRIYTGDQNKRVVRDVAMAYYIRKF